MKKMSLIIFVLGLLMIILYFIYPGLKDKYFDVSTINWIVVDKDNINNLNIEKYDTGNLKEITLSNFENSVKHDYSISIPSDMSLLEYTNDSLKYANDELILDYSLGVTDINSYEAYYDLLFSRIAYPERELLKYQINDKTDAYLLKFYKDNAYQEKIIIIFKERLYYKVEISIKNKRFSNRLSSSIIEGIKANDANNVFNCVKNKCEIQSDSDLNKKIIYDIDPKKYVINNIDTNFGNKLNLYKVNENFETEAEIKILMVYYQDKEKIKNIMNNENTEDVNMGKYKVIKASYDNTETYTIQLDDNNIIICDIIKISNNLNTDELKSFILNFTYE